jgi:hypothetical protein
MAKILIHQTDSFLYEETLAAHVENLFADLLEPPVPLEFSDDDDDDE